MNIKDIKILRMCEGDIGENDTCFIIKNEDFEKAKQLCVEAKEKYYEEDYPSSLYEIVLELFEENDIEFTNFVCGNADYEF